MTRRPTSLYKFMNFAAIGGGVFVIGISLQLLFVTLGISAVGAYTLQLAITVWISFELNRRITWKTRESTRSSAVVFLVGRGVVSAVAWIVFVGLERLHTNHLLANAISVVIATVFNYLIGDRLAFTSPVPSPVPEAIQT